MVLLSTFTCGHNVMFLRRASGTAIVVSEFRMSESTVELIFSVGPSRYHSVRSETWLTRVTTCNLRSMLVNVHFFKVSYLATLAADVKSNRFKKGTFLSCVCVCVCVWGGEAGASEGRVVSESEHQKGRVMIPLCKLLMEHG